MQEIGSPCSVITSHGEPPDIKPLVLNPMAYTAPRFDLQSLQPAAEEVTVFQVKVWPEETYELGTIVEPGCLPPARERKHKRPYSPSEPVSSKKLTNKKGSVKKLKPSAPVEALRPEKPVVKPFSCDRCKSNYVVHPSRMHTPNSSKKKYRPRKAIDPVTKKTLTLCNACGLALTRPRQIKEKKTPPTEEAKRQYLEKWAQFAASLAESLKEPDASRLYCPAFKLNPCACLQDYIINEDEGETKKRASSMLAILKEAKKLSKQKNIFKISQESPQRGLLKRKSQMFEDFVLTKRLYLRYEVGLCERACQKILMYSNNFLHKNLKSMPGKKARIKKVCGKAYRELKPISELVNESCCNDRCVMLAVTHSKLLESWRLTAKLGQKEARRVLAEMLTPAGGTRANCYKFISMITGCSPTTICQVNEYMRRTQGDREPPEHGLKEYWRLYGKEKTKKSGKRSQPDLSANEDNADDIFIPPETDNPDDIYIPTETELQQLSPQEALKKLEIQRQKLVQMKKKLAQQQEQLVQQSSQTSNTSSQQLLHILEIPSSTPSVITSVSESTHPQPAISVLTPGGFEPLGNISVNLTSNSQTAYSNVVILSDSVLENQESVPSGSQNFSNVLECENAAPSQSQPSAANKESSDLSRIYYLES